MGTNIHVTDEVWTELNSRKKPGESFDDVLRRELNMLREDDSEAVPQAEETAPKDKQMQHSTPDPEIEAAMRELVADRPPQTNHGKEAVVLTMQILREQGNMSTSDVQEAVFERLESDKYQGPRGMWQSIQRYLGDADNAIAGIEKVGYGEWDYAGDDVVLEALSEQ